MVNILIAISSWRLFLQTKFQIEGLHPELLLRFWYPLPNCSPKSYVSLYPTAECERCPFLWTLLTLFITHIFWWLPNQQAERYCIVDLLGYFYFFFFLNCTFILPASFLWLIVIEAVGHHHANRWCTQITQILLDLVYLLNQLHKPKVLIYLLSKYEKNSIIRIEVRKLWYGFSA